MEKYHIQINHTKSFLVGYSKNMAVSMSTGQYLCFMDIVSIIIITI